MALLQALDINPLDDINSLYPTLLEGAIIKIQRDCDDNQLSEECAEALKQFYAANENESLETAQKNFSILAEEYNRKIKENKTIKETRIAEINLQLDTAEKKLALFGNIKTQCDIYQSHLKQDAKYLAAENLAANMNLPLETPPSRLVSAIKLQ